MKEVIVCIIWIMALPFGVNAQGDYYENIGKIYVVVAVAAVLIIGIAAFLLYLDKRISKLEKQIIDEYRNK